MKRGACAGGGALQYTLSIAPSQLGGVGKKFSAAELLDPPPPNAEIFFRLLSGFNLCSGHSPSAIPATITPLFIAHYHWVTPILSENCNLSCARPRKAGILDVFSGLAYCQISADFLPFEAVFPALLAPEKRFILCFQFLSR